MTNEQIHYYLLRTTERKVRLPQHPAGKVYEARLLHNTSSSDSILKDPNPISNLEEIPMVRVIQTSYMSEQCFHQVSGAQNSIRFRYSHGPILVSSVSTTAYENATTYSRFRSDKDTFLKEETNMIKARNEASLEMTGSRRREVKTVVINHCVCKSEPHCNG